MIRTLCFPLPWLVLGFLSLCAWAVPDVPPFGIYEDAMFSPTVTILQCDADTIRLQFEMENLPEDSLINLFRRMHGTWGELNETGALLPRITIYLALPPQGIPTLTIESWDTTAYRAQSRTLPENNPRPPLATLGEIGILGGVRIIPLTLRPVSYTNQEDTCQILTQAVIRLAIDDQTGPNPVWDPPAAFSRTWQKVLESVVTNWEYIPNFYTTEPSHLLMIVPDQQGANFIPTIESFVRWKEQRGIKVTVVPKSDLGQSPGPSQLRSRILSEYQDAEPRIDHVLLVGDETMLPASSTFTGDPASRFSEFSYPGSYSNELYYATLEGTDLYPDIFLGRWVVNTEAEVRKVTRRVLMHERDTFLTDSLRFTKAASCADMTENSQRVTKRNVRTFLLDHEFSRVDTLWGWSVSPQQLINWINNGRSFVNYRGSGWSDGWAGIDFHLSEIEDLANHARLPIITGIGCGVGIFNGPNNTGFAESFMLAGGTNFEYGAVGFVGPCWNTHTVYNDCLDSLLYRAWFDYDVPTLSAGLASGKMMTWAVFNQFLNETQVREITETLMRQYIVQGDPTLQVFTNTPFRLDVTAPDSLPDDTTVLTLAIANLNEIPADSLNLTIWQNDSTAKTFWITPGSGDVIVPFDSLAEDTLVVTLTGDNILAFQKIIPIYTPSGVEPGGNLLPQQLELAQNYPNPFNPETVIEFALPHSGPVTLEIFDILGKRVATLVDGTLNAGRHRATWRATPGGASAASGVYFYRLTSADGTLSRKMLLLR